MRIPHLWTPSTCPPDDPFPGLFVLVAMLALIGAGAALLWFGGSHA